MEAVPFIGISRHRINIDGTGVNTLAAFHGCPLHCRYCLNPTCFGKTDELTHYTPETLFDYVRIDNIYFLYTGGGICFGGGEPLLRTDFIRKFRKLCGNAWKITAETSLGVPRSSVEAAAEVIDDFIVDIKDSNPTIYKAYTGRSNRQSLQNLRWLISAKGAEHIMVRVPLIPDFNTEADRNHTVALLQEMGITQIDKFNYVVPQKSQET